MILRGMTMCLVAGLGVLCAWMIASPAPQTMHAPRLNVQLITPTKNGHVVTDSMRWTDVRFRVANVSRQPLRQLELETDCGIRVIGPIPETLAAGFAFDAIVRIKAPPRGKIVQRIPVYAERERHPLAWLVAPVEVAIDPPLLGTPLRDCTIITVAGDSQTHRVRLTTIERRHDPPWIIGLRCEPPDLATIHLSQTSEEADVDPRFWQRTYEFSVSQGSPGSGAYSGSFHLDVRDELAPPPAPAICRFETLPRIAISPHAIELGNSQDHALFSAVDRLGLSSPTVRSTDADAVAVREVTGNHGLFEVFRTMSTNDLVRLVVDCDGDSTVLVSVLPGTRP